MSRFKDLCIDHEEMFHDEVAYRVPSFETYQSALIGSSPMPKRKCLGWRRTCSV